MANNYEQATVTPLIPSWAVTPEQLEALRICGFSYEIEQEYLLYFFCEEATCNEDSEGNAISYEGIFSEIGRKAGIAEIVIMAAFYCDKLRPGEFGGWVTRITQDGIQSEGTYSILEKMRRGTLPPDENEFRNFYRCPVCDTEWDSVWSATCDDECGNCGARNISPYKSEDA